MSHLPLTLVYDPEVLEVAGWKRGDFLGGEGEAEVLAAEPEPGKLLVGASRLGDAPGVTGDGCVVTLTFQARKAGRTTVTLQDPRALGPGLQALASPSR